MGKSDIITGFDYLVGRVWAEGVSHTLPPSNKHFGSYRVSSFSISRSMSSAEVNAKVDEEKLQSGWKVLLLEKCCVSVLYRKHFTVTTLASLLRDLATLQRNLLNLLFLIAAEINECWSADLFNIRIQLLSTS